MEESKTNVSSKYFQMVELGSGSLNFLNFAQWVCITYITKNKQQTFLYIFTFSQSYIWTKFTFLKLLMKNSSPLPHTQVLLPSCIHIQNSRNIEARTQVLTGNAVWGSTVSQII